MSEDVKPRKFYIQNPHLNICTWTKYSAYEPEVNPSIEDEIRAIELEPTLQLMKEMSEALKENGLSHDFDCGIAVNGRHECSCGYLKSKEVLEKYRKFLEGIQK